ncbi:hypothetical protein VCRA2121O157_90135 [Vibrio crassostreae]|nr:hypothetical protein VCRA2113O138_100125 [Vibrio crassostreae]CAK1721788.1 hypothetical protein VCRA2113O140_110124 [Vibrio crassostreae]CAK2225031.1 hypothetical protein VCRA2116O141_110042 [Vibrio crassostreae]CAK2594025.1 hypothetical protein VCRA2113O139_110126 [Vibrio crassostreae]CAK2812632.1 hypothetical protein VCRA2119O149_20032 [Vibrio crassostreae]
MRLDKGALGLNRFEKLGENLEVSCFPYGFFRRLQISTFYHIDDWVFLFQSMVRF